SCRQASRVAAANVALCRTSAQYRFPDSSGNAGRRGWGGLLYIGYRTADCMVVAPCEATRLPEARLAIRRSTTGATTKPMTVHAPSTPNVSIRCQEEATSAWDTGSGSIAERMPSAIQ